MKHVKTVALGTILGLSLLVCGCTEAQKEQVAGYLEKGGKVAETVAPVSGSAAPFVYAIGTIAVAISGWIRARKQGQAAQSRQEAIRLLGKAIDAWRAKEPAEADKLLSFLATIKADAEGDTAELWRVVDAARKGLA